MKKVAYMIAEEECRCFSRSPTSFVTATGCCWYQNHVSAAGSLDSNCCCIDSSNGPDKCNKLNFDIRCEKNLLYAKH